jgi:uncharacterized protein YjbJ (UPF0337 family)
MINDVVEEKWKIFPGKIRKWWKKRSDNQLTKAKRKREHYIGILQKRYGYTKEEATSELDRHYSKARLCSNVVEGWNNY